MCDDADKRSTFIRFFLFAVRDKIYALLCSIHIHQTNEKKEKSR